MRRAEAGFTLIELLVAMTILALLATVITRALGSTNLVIQKGGARTAAMIATIDTQDVLKREIGRARPFVLDRNGKIQPVFIATAERLRFIAVQPVGRPGAVFDLVELAIEDAAGSKRLTLRRTAWSDDLPEMERELKTAVPTVLDAGNDYHLRYYGSAEADTSPAWVAVWPPDAPDLPKAVGVTIERAQEDNALPLPELVATFPVLGKAVCGEDKIDCRLLSRGVF